MQQFSSKGRRNARLVAVSGALALGALLVGGPTLADPTEPDPDKVDSQCGAAVKELAKKAGAVLKDAAKADADSLQANFSTMRSDCADLRACKRTCRQNKRAAKKNCKGLRGKAKRQCKRDARKAKRSCKKECRGAETAKACKSSRKTFWKGVGKVVGKAARDKGVRAQGKKVLNECKALYSK